MMLSDAEKAMIWC